MAAGLMLSKVLVVPNFICKTLEFAATIFAASSAAFDQPGTSPPAVTKLGVVAFTASEAA